MFQIFLHEIDVPPVPPYSVRFALMRTAAGFSTEGTGDHAPFSEIARPVSTVKRLLFLERRLGLARVRFEDLKGGIQELDRDVSTIERNIPRILNRYHQLLEDEGFCSFSGRLELLLKRFGEREHLFPPFEEVKKLTVEGLGYLPPLYFDLFQELCRIVDQADVQFQFNPEREEAFRWVEQTIKQFERTEHTHQVVDPFFRTYRRRSENTLRFVTKNLFRDPEELIELDKREEDESVHFLESSNPESEAETVGKKIRSLLQQGTPEEDIAVVFREGAEVSERFERVFHRLGISCRTTDDRLFSINPVSEAVRLLLRTVADHYPPEKIKQILRHQLLGGPAEGRSVHLDTILRESGISEGGWEEWKQGLDKYRSVLNNRIEAAEDSENSLINSSQRERFQVLLEETRELEERLEDVFEELELSRSELEIGELAEWLLERMDAFEVGSNLNDVIDQTGFDNDALQGYSAFRKFLQSLKRIQQSISTPFKIVSTQEAVQIFEEFWEQFCKQEGATSSTEREGVYLLSAEALQGTTFSTVFLVQLHDEMWPRSVVEDPFLQDDLIRNINNRKKRSALNPTNRKRWKELYLFYRAVSSATEKLFLSWSKTDSTGDEQFASSFLDDIRKLITENEQDSPPSEAFSGGNSSLRSRKRSLFQVSSESDVEFLGRRILLERNRRRFFLDADPETGSDHSGPWSGVLRNSDLLQERSTSFLAPDHTWSPTALEKYTQCPYAFYSQRILDLDEESETKYGLDAASEGLLIHEILRRMYGPSRFDREDGPSEKEIRDVCESVFSIWEELGFQGDPAFWEVNRERILLRVNRLCQRLEDQLDTTVEGVEVPFGPSSETPPVTFDEYQSPLKVKGRIDRIDVGDSGKKGYVWDYKNTRSSQRHRQRTRPDTFGEKSFQLPVYLLAVQGRFGEGDGTIREWSGGFVMVKEEHSPIIEMRAGNEQEYEEWIGRLREQIYRGIKRISDRVRSGVFSVAPDPCLRSCPYRTMCRYTQTGQ